MTDFDTQGAEEAAEAMARAFEIAGERIAVSLESAATSGELSFNRLAESILQDLARLAINEVFSSLFGQGGGGPAAAPMTVNFNVSGVSNAQDLQRSSGQIAGQLARAVVQGQRYL